MRHTGREGDLLGWFNRRTGVVTLFREQMDEPIPGGPRVAYVFGSALLFVFVSQFVTGFFLALYYVPSADHAHTTVAYIAKVVTCGSLLRSVHAYGSSALVILLLLHVTQTFLYGSYKGHRELLWLSGCFLFALVLCLAFTGYLLPWDQKAYFATAVGANVAGEVPVVGPWVKALLIGGSEMGTLTLSRFFVAHILVLPAGVFAFVALHVGLFRKAGAAGPIHADPLAPTLHPEPFYPKQLILDAGCARIVLSTLFVVSRFFPFELGPKANPADPSYLPRPEWYYLPLFQWLKYWPGPLSFIGTVVVPGLVAFLFASLPFLDKGVERRPWRRPLAVGCYVFIFLARFGLAGLSYRSDRADPVTYSQLTAQKRAAKDFMQRRPFEAKVSAGTADSSQLISITSDPLVAQGRALFGARPCSACHGAGGAGGLTATALIGISHRIAPDRLPDLLAFPGPKMRAGGMPPVKLPPDQMQALVAYLKSL